MAEQLGAGGRPSGDAGPDWAQTARSTSAPDWATQDAGPQAEPSGDAGGGDDGVPGGLTGPQRPAQQQQTAPRAEPPGTGQTNPDPFGGAPSDDDEDLSTSGAVGQPVIESVLGGTVIEINDEPVG
jgi:DNA polymerase-3 subunit gamma/tau